MNNTNADLHIIHALCPGPEVADVGVTNPSAILPSLSFNPAVGSPLFTYASNDEIRCSKLGAGGSAAKAECLEQTVRAININSGSILFMIRNVEVQGLTIKRRFLLFLPFECEWHPQFWKQKLFHRRSFPSSPL